MKKFLYFRVGTAAATEDDMLRDQDVYPVAKLLAVSGKIVALVYRRVMNQYL